MLGHSNAVVAFLEVDVDSIHNSCVQLCTQRKTDSKGYIMKPRNADSLMIDVFENGGDRSEED